ncbi:MAG: type II toxin-antitoxin system VapC family toxin [Caldilineaceae bacterium]
MTLYVLDTDHVSLSQREQPFVLQRMAAAGRHSLATTIITVEEQISGRFAVIKRASVGEKLIWAYQDLEHTLGYFTTLAVLSFTAGANRQYEALRRQKIRIGTQDLRIAAIVLSINGMLVTRNWKDFQQEVRHLLEDWSLPLRNNYQ